MCDIIDMAAVSICYVLVLNWSMSVSMYWLPRSSHPLLHNTDNWMENSVCCYRQMHVSLYYVFGAWYPTLDLPLHMCTCEVYDAPHVSVEYVDNICTGYT